jgi:hypothetical protein
MNALRWISPLGALFVHLTLMGSSSLVHAETKTYCDNKCGDTQKCQYICCHVTYEPFPTGGEYVSKLSCSSSSCCAHPPRPSSIGPIDVPRTPVTGVAAPIKLALVAAAGVDASLITVESDETNKIVNLKGAVASEAERKLVEQIAQKEATGFKVNNLLIIEKRSMPQKK